MKPVLVTIGGLEVHSLVVFTAIGFLLFTFLLWINLRAKIKTNSIFDIILLSLILSPVLGRLLYIIEHFSRFVHDDWNFLPVRDSVEGVAFFDTAPWSFFAIWSGGNYYNFIPIALFIGTYAILRFTRQSKQFAQVLSKVWAGFLPAFIVILLGFLLQGVYYGQTGAIPLKVVYEGENEARIAIQIIEIVIVLFIMIFYLDTGSKKAFFAKYRSFLFPVIWSISEVLIWFKVEQYSKDLYIFDVVQVMWLVFLLLQIVLMVAERRTVLLRKRSENVVAEIGDRKKTLVKNGKKLNKDYKVSYSSYSQSFSTDLSMSEKVRKARNRVKRGIS